MIVFKKKIINLENFLLRSVVNNKIKLLQIWTPEKELK